jgi:hypothetical protein
VHPESQQVALVFFQPTLSHCVQRLRLGHAFGDRRFWDKVPCVFHQIPLLAQVIQPDQRLRVNAQRRRQRLNCRLMVPWPAGKRSVAMSMQAHISEHPNRCVYARKAGLGAYRLNLRVSDIPRGSVEQALNRFFDGRDLRALVPTQRTSAAAEDFDLLRPDYQSNCANSALRSDSHAVSIPLRSVALFGNCPS